MLDWPLHKCATALDANNPPWKSRYKWNRHFASQLGDISLELRKLLNDVALEDVVQIANEVTAIIDAAIFEHHKCIVYLKYRQVVPSFFQPEWDNEELESWRCSNGLTFANRGEGSNLQWFREHRGNFYVPTSCDELDSYSDYYLIIALDSWWQATKVVHELPEVNSFPEIPPLRLSPHHPPADLSFVTLAEIKCGQLLSDSSRALQLSASMAARARLLRIDEKLSADARVNHLNVRRVNTELTELKALRENDQLAIKALTTTQKSFRGGKHRKGNDLKALAWAEWDQHMDGDSPEYSSPAKFARDFCAQRAQNWAGEISEPARMIADHIRAQEKLRVKSGLPKRVGKMRKL